MAQSDGTWSACTDNGREITNLNVEEWAIRGQELGAGEILLTSIDREGTCRGFDTNLTRAVATSVSIPVIASGGMGSANDFSDVIQQGHADAVAMAHVLHFEEVGLEEIRSHARQQGLHVRYV